MIAIEKDFGTTKPASQIGKILRVPSGDDTGNVVVVTDQTQRWIAEDGLSLGLDDDQGWLVTLLCREATPEERAQLEAAEKAEADAEAKRRARDAARRELFAPELGEYVQPKPGDGQLRLDGTPIPWGQGFTIYGGGEEIVVAEDGLWIWWLINHGGDGDDWSRNNVATGGAGAIGRRYPATWERLAFLRTLPGGEQIGLTKAERRLDTIRRYAARVTFPSKLASLFADPPIDAGRPPPSVWVDLEDRATWPPPRLGMDPNGTSVSVCCAYASRFSEDDAPPPPYEVDIYSDSGQRVFPSYAATPERMAAIRALWPSWVGTSAPGRYVLKSVLGHLCENAADALEVADMEKLPISEVEVTPEVTIVYASPGVERGRKGVLLWSDGVATRVRAHAFWSRGRYDPCQEPWRSQREEARERAGFPTPPAPPAPSLQISDAAAELLAVALGQLGQKAWIAERRYEELFTIASMERTRADHRERRGRGSGEEVTLERVVATHRDGKCQTLWYLHGSWAAMGAEDADGGEDHLLFESEGEARAEFRSLYG